jgi:hypothetical protein
MYAILEISPEAKVVLGVQMALLVVEIVMVAAAVLTVAVQAREIKLGA